jgi:hypothetical protein
MNSESEIFPPIVNVDSGLKALDVPRLDRATEVLPQAEGDSIGSSQPSNPVRKGGMIPFSLTLEEKSEVVDYIRSLGPQYQNSTVILDKSDIPEDLLDQVSFADREESEVQIASRQLLDGMRRCKARNQGAQPDSCS